jgi:hypothetical protein
VTKTAGDLEKVHAAFKKWLHLSDEDVEIIDIALGTEVAIHNPGDRLWALLVGPPGSGKTEIIRSLRGYPTVKFVSTLSPKTLMSGFRPGGKDYSLLPKLDKKLLVIKDLTAIMDMPPDQQRQIFGMLRDGFDGFSDHARGNMEEASYDAQFGLLAAVTDIIDQPRRIVETEVGDRYLKIRFRGNDHEAKARRAFDNVGREDLMRHEIGDAVHGFLGGLNKVGNHRNIPGEELLEMAQWLSPMRIAVRRDHNRSLTAIPSPEVPTRIVKQLTQLVRALAIVRGHSEIEAEDIQTARRAAEDTAVPLRFKVLRVLEASGQYMSAADIATASRLPETSARTVAEDLWILHFLDREGSAEIMDALRYKIRVSSLASRKRV